MRGNGTRAVVPVLVVLGLLAVVAVAATGSTRAGGNSVRSPGATLLDTFFSLALLAVVAGGVLVVYGLLQRRAVAEEVASGRYRRGSLLGWIAFVSIFTVVVVWRGWDFKRPAQPPISDLVPPRGAPPPSGNPVTDTTPYEPHIAWVPVGAVVALLAIAVAAYVISERRRRPAARERDDLAVEVVAVLDDTLDDLRAETDPRRAVIAAYVRLEQVLAAHGLPRRRAETEEELLVRMLAALHVSPAPARRLTGLFEGARFSDHVVDSGMKDEAIAALEQVRDELAASAGPAEIRAAAVPT